MKRIGTIVGVLVVLTVGAGAAGVAILSSMDFNQYKGLVAERVKAATGRDLAIQGDLNLEISLSPALAVHGVSFANADWGSRPQMVTLERLEARVSLIPLLSGTVQVEELVLHGVDVLVETDKAGRGNWEFAAAGSKPEPAGEAQIPVVQEVDLKDVKLTWRDGASGETMELGFDALSFEADDPDSPLELELEGKYNGAPYAVSGTLGPVALLTGGGKPYPVDLKVSALDLTASVDGTVAQPLQGKGLELKLGLQVADTGASFKAAKAVVPALRDAGPVPAVKVDFSGRLTDSDGGYALDGINLKAGDSDLSGRAGIRLGGKRPSIKADLTSALLDIGQFLPEGGKADKPAKSDDGRVFPDDPLPLDGLKAVDAVVAFRGDRVKGPNLEIHKVAADLTLKDGRLSVEPFSLALADGTIGGRLVVDAGARRPQVAADIKVAALDYGKLLKQYQLTDIAEGKVDVTLDVKGSGASVRDLMAGLSGKLRAVTENGQLESGLLNIASADVSSALPLFDSKDDKKLRCGVVDTDIASGMATHKALVFETGGLSLVGEGRINLATEQLDMKLTPRAKKTSLAKFAQVPFNVTGTLAEPKARPDEMETAKSAATGAATVLGAIATGGASLAVQALADKASDAVVDRTDYCALALAGKTVRPESVSEAESVEKAPSGDAAAPSSDGGSGGVKDAVKGLGEGLKGLFGN